MWELAQAHQGNPALVEQYLRDGYEPFAVSTDANSFAIIWLRRKVEDEIHPEQKPVKRASRRVTKKPKG